VIVTNKVVIEGCQSVGDKQELSFNYQFILLCSAETSFNNEQHGSLPRSTTKTVSLNHWTKHKKRRILSDEKINEVRYVEDVTVCLCTMHERLPKNETGWSCWWKEREIDVEHPSPAWRETVSRTQHGNHSVSKQWPEKTGQSGQPGVQVTGQTKVRCKTEQIISWYSALRYMDSVQQRENFRPFLAVPDVIVEPIIMAPCGAKGLKVWCSEGVVRITLASRWRVWQCRLLSAT